MSARWLIAVLCASTLATSGCELVAGLKDREIDDSAAGAGGSAAGAGGSGGSAGVAGAQGGGGSGQSGTSGSAGSPQGGSGAQGGGGAGGSVGGQSGGSAGTNAIAGSSGTGGATAGAGGGGASGIGGAGGLAGSGGVGGMGGLGGSGGAPPVCALNQTTKTGLRVGSLVPNASSVDFCFKSAAATDYTGVTPILRSVSSACPPGFAYKQLSAPFDLPPGIYDVKAIDGNAPDCTDPGIATLPNVVTKSSARTDVFLVPGATAAAAAALVTLEESSVQQFDTAVRFIPYGVDVGPVDVAIADSPELPATLTASLLSDLSFGALATSSPFGNVDSAGYLQVNAAGASINVGVAPTGTTDATLVRSAPFVSGYEQSIFVVGSATNLAFPPELLVCNELVVDDTNKWLAQCNGGTSSAVSVRFQTFNTQQTGVFVIDGPERLQPSLDAMSNDDSDILCAGELWDETQKQALITEAKANFPYSVEYETDYTTAVDDPTDAMGKTPAPWSTPPCAGNSVAKMNAVVDCARDMCSTSMTMDENATAVPGQCLSTSCQSPFTPLLLTDPTCFSCTLTHLQSFQTMANTRSECTTLPGARYAYNGNNGQVMLSKLPLKNVSQILLPSTEWRVAILHADVTVESPGGSTDVGVYCTTLTTPAGDSITRPYTGQWGDGMTKGAGWNAENLLQANKLISYVSKTSGGRHSVVLGEFYAGPDYNDGTTQVLTSITPMTFAALTSSFAPALVTGYTPACTYCSANPLNGGSVNEWESHIFLHSIATTDVLATSRHFMDPVVAVMSGTPPTTTMVPLSTHYGLRSVVTFSP